MIDIYKNENISEIFYHAEQIYYQQMKYAWILRVLVNRI